MKPCGSDQTEKVPAGIGHTATVPFMGAPVCEFTIVPDIEPELPPEPVPLPPELEPLPEFAPPDPAVEPGLLLPEDAGEPDG